MPRYRKKTEEKKDNLPWLMTYSDMVTLCLTFFVLLYSFSTIDAIKWRSVVISVQGALGLLDGGKNVTDGPPGNDPADAEGKNIDERENDINRMDEFLQYQQDMMRLDQIQAELSAYLEGKGIATSVTVGREERGLVLRFQDSVLFQKGRAELLPGSDDILKNVAAVLNNVDNPIRIEGHTDDLPINTPQFPSNWELSARRATNVLRFLMNCGLPGQRLSAAGYGEFYPLVPNSSEENRRKNRRVDIVIIREGLRSNEPKQ